MPAFLFIIGLVLFLFALIVGVPSIKMRDLISLGFSVQVLIAALVAIGAGAIVSAIEQLKDVMQTPPKKSAGAGHGET